MNELSTKNYFRRSPFRSLGFDVSTGILVILLWSDLKAMGIQSPSQVNAAVLGLMALPVAVWIVLLVLYWEIRAVVEQTDGTSVSPLTELHYSRLARLHWSLSLGVTIMSWGIIQALITAMGAHR